MLGILKGCFVAEAQPQESIFLVILRSWPFWDGENVTLFKGLSDLRRLGMKRSLWITWLFLTPVILPKWHLDVQVFSWHKVAILSIVVAGCSLCAHGHLVFCFLMVTTKDIRGARKGHCIPLQNQDSKRLKESYNALNHRINVKILITKQVSLQRWHMIY